MNFKPTFLKSIISLIIGLVTGFLLAWQNLKTGGWTFFPVPFLVITIILFIIIYLIWSLFEKK